MPGDKPNLSDTTVLMIAAAKGEPHAADRLLPLVYEQLRKTAALRMAGERTGHTLSATALVHEAYARLTGPGEVEWAGRAHFYAAAAEAMRRILVDHARAKGAKKRGSGEARRAAASLSALPDPASEIETAGFLILNEAIARLEEVDPRVAEVVRLRYFAGLGIEETALALGVSAPTVKRAWAFARGWLKERIETQED